jgi:hypothetical protein
VGYFTIHSKIKRGFIDWDWLSNRKSVEEKQFTRHLRFARPITIKMNGHQNKGIILKPEEDLG